MLFRLAKASLRARKTSVLLTIFSISVSVFILLAVQHSQAELKASFKRTVSGVDLIVGSRTAPINLLLYSVFRIGNASNNLEWRSYQKVAGHKQVDWSIPLSLGDSHKGYRVLGTTPDYFAHYKYGNKQALTFSSGHAFERLYGVVLGADVAKKFKYQLNDKLVLSHGTGNVSFSKHTGHPFTVVGILSPTGTAIDQTVHVSLQGIEVIHETGSARDNLPLNSPQMEALKPKTITAFMLGFKSRIATLTQQRSINQFKGEPLTAIIPGVTLSELWRVMAMVENLLSVIAALVLLAALLGMATMLLASMRERQAEIALLRAIGARPGFVFLLIELEALLLAFWGLVLGYASLTAILALSQSWLASEYGLFISPWLISPEALTFAGSVLVLAMIMAMIPAISCYRSSLASRLK